MGEIWKVRSVETVFTVEQLPCYSLPEVVFAGRSNVGKSSLINRLLGQKAAYVGATPGKTRSINFYIVDASAPFTLVDLPGYGYAVAGKAEKEKWAKLVRRYFDSKPLPPLVLHLVDFRHGFLERDLELSEWLSGMRVGELPVFTKIDKISRGARRATLEKYLKNLSIPEQNCILTSSEDNSGIEELRTLIENYGRSA